MTHTGEKDVSRSGHETPEVNNESQLLPSAERDRPPHVGKKFAEYAAERAQQASPEESAWVAAFDAACRGERTLPPVECPHCGTRFRKGEPCPLCHVLPPASGEVS